MIKALTTISITFGHGKKEYLRILEVLLWILMQFILKLEKEDGVTESHWHKAALQLASPAFPARVFPL